MGCHAEQYEKNNLCQFFKDKNYAEINRNPIVPVKENKSAINFFNKNKDCIAKIHIDGGLIKSSEKKKADYMVINCDKKTSYIIELKGCDLVKACSQILSTVNEIKHYIDGSVINARIILTRVISPSLNSSEQKKLQKFCKDKGGTLIIRSALHEEDI